MSINQYPMQYRYPSTVAELKELHLDDDPAAWYTLTARTILDSDVPCEQKVRQFDHFNEQFQRCQSIEDLQIMVCRRAIEGKL